MVHTKLRAPDGDIVQNQTVDTAVDSITVFTGPSNPRVLINGENVGEVQKAYTDGLVLTVEVRFPLNQRPTLSIDGGPDELDKYLQTSGSIGELIISGIHPDLCECSCPPCRDGQHDCCEGYLYGESEKDMNCEGFNNVTVLLRFD